MRPWRADQDAIGDGEDLRQIGGDDHDGLAFVGEAVDDLVDLGDRADIDAAGRLVEDDERGSCASDLAITTFC